MTKDFDVYYKWLGIPPREQPPNHYRLLAINHFESDPDVISNAADQRMALLRTFQIGDRAADSQRLLNEVATARHVLLNEDRKAGYDAALRRKTTTPEHPAAAPAIAKPVTTPSKLVQAVPLIRAAVSSPASDVFPDLTAEQQVRGTSRRRRGERQKPRSSAPVIAVAAIVLVVISLIAWALNSPTTVAPKPLAAARSQAADPPAHPLPPTKRPEKAPTGSQSDADENKSASPVVESNPTPLDVDAAPLDLPPFSVSSPIPTTSVKPEPLTLTPSPPRELDTLAATAVSRRPAAPTGQERKDGLRRVRELYRTELAAAVSMRQKWELASRFRRAAQENVDDERLRFPLLELAKELGIQACMPTQIVAACNELAIRYDLDLVAVKQDALIEATKGSRTPAEHRELALALRTAANEAIATDRFASAQQLAKAEQTSARKSKNLELAKEAAAHAKQVDAISKEAEKTRAARGALAARSDDPAANLALGRLECFFQGDWVRGLSQLALGGENPAALLARREQMTPPGSRDSIAIADAWWDLGVAEPSFAQQQIQLHAGDLYSAARTLSGGGLTQTKLEQRLTAVAGLADEPPRIKFADGWWRIAQCTTGRFVSVSEGSHNAGHPLIVWDRSAAEQHWHFEFDAQGLARLINRNSGLALGIRQGSSQPGADGIQWNPSNYDCRVEHVSGDVVRVIFRHGGLCLDSPDGRIVQSLPGETETQFWRLEKAE